ncbi:MAG: hypothetical protein JXC36_08910 [Candidatus Atribacteria bacterium]|nr:hypothetical protein [Candidatus Atribacteria bacterium]
MEELLTNTLFVGKFLKLPDFAPSMSKSEIISKLKKASKLDILFILSRIDLVLSNHELPQYVLQKEIVRLLFSAQNSSRILQYLFDEKSYTVIFHRQQIYYTVSLALRFSNDSDYGTISPEFRENLGWILLNINEILDDEPISILGNPAIHELQLFGHMWQIANFSAYLDYYSIGKEFARTYKIYFESESGQIVKEMFEKITGVNLLKFWMIVLPVYAHWLKNKYDFREDNLFFDFNFLLAGSHRLTEEEVYKSVSLISRDITKFQEEIDRSLNAFGNDNYNFEFLREFPILQFETKKLVCLSLPYFIFRITRGIVHIIRKEQFEKGYKEDFSKAFGEAYEGYVRDELIETYNSGLAKRVYSGNSKTNEISDGVIDYGDKIVFIEVKALSMKKIDRLSNSHKDIEKGLRNFLFKKGAKQLDKKIKQFKSGEIKIGTLEPNNYRVYLPVLVTCIDEVPIFGNLATYYYRLLEQYDILQSNDIAPIIFLSIDEYEDLIQLVRNGHSLIDILIDKNSTPKNRLISFYNFLSENESKYRLDEKPAYIKEMIDKFTEKALNDLSQENL